MVKKLLFLGCYLFSVACSAQNEDLGAQSIHRFDKSLYHYIQEKNDDASFQDPFLAIYGDNILNLGKPDSLGFKERLKTYFSEPTLLQLYKDEQEKFADIAYIQEELLGAFAILMKEFPQIQQPKFYMHVSGLNQSVVVSEDVLSISADKYMGADYPLYQSFFHDYQRKLMKPENIVPDYILGFMMANFPFKGREDVLLDRMIYEGKLRYILSRVIPQREVWDYVSYDKEEYLWCSNKQSQLWKTIVGSKHLNTPNYLLTSQYLKQAPYTSFLSTESPGRVGIWFAYQIVMSYMKQHPQTSLLQLMQLEDYPQFLKDAKYKP